MGNKMEHLRNMLGEVYDLQAINLVLGWDQQVNMPPGGAEARSHHLATVNRVSHQKFVSDEMGAALQAAKDELEAAGAEPDSNEMRIVIRVQEVYEKLRKVPSEWVAEFARMTSLAQRNWEDARQGSDFAMFQPHLEKVIKLRRQYADFFAPYDHVYDPLLDYFEPGMKTAQVRAVFDELRPQQVALVRKIADSGVRIDDSILHQPYDEQKQWDFGVEVIKALGFDFEHGRQDKSIHPFTTHFSPKDVRITTRINPNFLNPALFGSMHEAGHAMYEQGIGEGISRTPISQGASLGVHESQSRMWENLIGRGYPFWKAYYSRLQSFFPEILGDTSLDKFYRAINKVEPSLIRVEADEATYNLHIMLRVELELALVEGTLAVGDLPEAWNTKMEEYLGIRPSNDAEGVLQDVHWASGYIGYFSTYSLGNLMAAMLWEKIEQDIPNMDALVEQAQFSDLLAWLRENIHQHGAKYKPADLMMRVTGKTLTAEPYVRYLTNKFSDIYRL